MSSSLRKLLLLRYIPRAPKSIDTTALHSRLLDEGYMVTERTVQRDLEELSISFAICSDESSKPYHWFFPLDAEPVNIPAMSPQMALTFKLVEKFARNSFPKHVLDNLAPYFEQSTKELNSLGNNRLAKWPNKVEAISDGMIFQPPNIKNSVIEAVYEGLLNNKCLQGVYTPRGSDTQKNYQIHPLGIVSKGAVIYLVCTLRDYGDIVQLALHRFDSAQLINIDLSYPDDFDLKEYVEKGGFGILNSDKIIIFVGRFQLKQGQHLFETPLSSDQVVTMETDGRFTLKASVPDTMYFRWWLLSLGDKVEVLEPRWLKDKIVETARHTLSLYE
tara:strand:- start:6286 stop:7278 length:993 start_codon:yes stop_codon:yes gene_type:complete